MHKVPTEEKRVSIYQVLPRLFGNSKGKNLRNGTIEENGSGKLSHFTPTILKEIADLGCTHIWYTGVIEHATGTAFEGIPANNDAVLKGIAGSPYAIRDYFDIAPSLAVKVGERQQEFDNLVDRTHKAGLGVIIDFVPNHVSREYHSDVLSDESIDLGYDDKQSVAFDKDNNFYYLPSERLTLPHNEKYNEYPAKATGNNIFHPYPTTNDWYETVKLNYGIDYFHNTGNHFDPIPNTWKKMLAILHYWAKRGVDGFRCDMAEMVPPQFWDWAIGELRKEFPDLLFIGEVYQPNLYQTYIQAGFNYLYDKVGLYDTLVKVIKGEAPATAITTAWQQLTTPTKQMLHFMENHDEQRLASDFITGSGEKAFPAMVVSSLIDNAALMTYFGQELGEKGMDEEGFSGQDGRTSIFDYWRIDTIERWLGAKKECKGEKLTPTEQKLRAKYQTLLRIATETPIFTTGGFFDLMYLDHPRLDKKNTYTFLRATEEEVALIVVNFTQETRRYQLTIPLHAFQTLRIKKNAIWYVEDLMTKRKSIAQLDDSTPYEIEVPPYGAAIHHFRPTEANITDDGDNLASPVQSLPLSR